MLECGYTVKDWSFRYNLERTCARKQLESMVKLGQMQKEICGPRVVYRFSTPICWHNPFNLSPGEIHVENLAAV